MVFGPAQQPSRRERSVWNTSTLESRLMLAGDVAAAVATDTAAMPTVASPSGITEGERACDRVDCSQLVFFDETLEDLTVLQSAVADGAEIVLIRNDGDPLRQISKALEVRGQVQRVSIITHGIDGALKFGDSMITEKDLEARGDEIRDWRSSLTFGADLLLFGCDVAASDTGRSFVTRLADLTGADVAASIDRTGNLAQNGDWELEYTIGEVGENQVLCSTVVQRYSKTLDIVLHAWGQTGDELVGLVIDDSLVSVFNMETTYQAFRFETDQSITADQVKVRFLNDAYRPNENYDRNVTIESIQIDGQFYETEDISVRSTGTYRSEDGLRTGFGRGEILHSTGDFEFGTNLPRGGSRLEITAAGETGAERFSLSVGGAVVGDFDVTTQDQTFVYETEIPIQADDVRITFLNDLFIGGRVDQNLIIDHISIDGQVFESEAPNVFSTGTWTPLDGITPGFRQSEILHANGYFQYGADSLPGGSLEIDSSFGTEGVLRFGESSRGTYPTPDGGFIRTDGNQIQKFNSEFQLDSSFGNGGVAAIPTETAIAVRDLTVLSDGTTIALSLNGSTLDNYQLHRLSASGEFLNSVVVDDLGAGPLTKFGSGPQLESTSNDTIVLGGGKNNSSVVALIGLNADLSINTGFGNNGIAEHEGLIPNFSSLTDLVATPDGGLLSFTQQGIAAGPAGRALYKFTTTGALDQSYGNGGVSEMIPFENFGVSISQLQLDSSGRAVAHNNSEFIRWDANGFLDGSFGGDGMVALELIPVDVGNGQTRTLRPSDFGFDAQGRILVNQAVLQSRTSQPPLELGVMFGRVNSDGSTDATFGRQFVSAQSNHAVAGDVIFDSQGRLIIAGSLLGGSFTTDPAIARYLLS